MSIARDASPTATPASALPDADLARRIAAAGDTPARDEEAELCRRYGRRLVAFGRRRLGSEDSGRDLAQDALLLTIERLRAGRVREPERIGAFILGVARTMAGRRRSREGRVAPIDPADREPVTSSVAPPDPIARTRVRGCLEKLAEKQRAVVLLTFYAEQSSGAIASSLGLSSENVRVLRHRGVARLRDCLGLEGAAA